LRRDCNRRPCQFLVVALLGSCGTLSAAYNALNCSQTITLSIPRCERTCEQPGQTDGANGLLPGSTMCTDVDVMLIAPGTWLLLLEITSGTDVEATLLRCLEHVSQCNLPPVPSFYMRRHDDFGISVNSRPKAACGATNLSLHSPCTVHCQKLLVGLIRNLL
jgi:hypothetical protein